MDNFKKLSKSKAKKGAAINAPIIDYQAKLAEHGLTREQVIATERKLAKFANTMDSLVRIPFTKQGMGADAALSTIPLAGDLAGLALTSYAFILGRQLGVPAHKMTPAVRLALIDMVVGIVPGIGTVLDIFIRPDRKSTRLNSSHVKISYAVFCLK